MPPTIPATDDHYSTLSDLAGHFRDAVTEPDHTPGYRRLYAAVQDGRFPAPTLTPTERNRWVKLGDVPADSEAVRPDAPLRPQRSLNPSTRRDYAPRG